MNKENKAPQAFILVPFSLCVSSFFFSPPPTPPSPEKGHADVNTSMQWQLTNSNTKSRLPSRTEKFIRPSVWWFLFSFVFVVFFVLVLISTRFLHKQAFSVFHSFSIFVSQLPRQKNCSSENWGPELRSCVVVVVAVLGSPSLMVLMVSVGVKQHWTSQWQCSLVAVLGSQSLMVFMVPVDVKQHWTSQRQCSGAVWWSWWPSWAPTP